VVGQQHALAGLAQGERPGTCCIGGWVGVENLTLTRIQSLSCPACSE